MKVLFVEDREGIQKGWISELRHAAVQMFSAFNFEQAEKLYREHPDIDVVVVDSDLGIESENGDVFIRKIKGSFPGKIIAASSTWAGCRSLMIAGAHLSCEGDKGKVPEIIKQILAVNPEQPQSQD